MDAFYSDDQALHAPQWYLADGTVRPCPDDPARPGRIRAALEAAGVRCLPAGVDPMPAARVVHAADYLAYLETIHATWFAEFGADVMPDTFFRRAGTRRPTKPAAQAGYYCFDLAAPITAGTWRAAVGSARCAASAADAVARGARAAYALCRPPGHHAGAEYCGGFCYLNNAAVAAQHLLLAGRRRVAVLDVDYHHGNGTQDIFYARSDVLFVSIHAEPDAQYPYFWGHAEETGEGEGAGLTLNLPLPRGADEAAWFAALERACHRVAAHRAEALVVSLGVDTSAADTVGDFKLSRGAYARMAARIAALGLPAVIVQEGGYNLDDVGPSVAAFVADY